MQTNATSTSLKYCSHRVNRNLRRSGTRLRPSWDGKHSQILLKYIYSHLAGDICSASPVWNGEGQELTSGHCKRGSTINSLVSSRCGHLLILSTGTSVNRWVAAEALVLQTFVSTHSWLGTLTVARSPAFFHVRESGPASDCLAAEGTLATICET